MGKVFEFLSQRGSYLDWISKSTGTANFINFVETEKGLSAEFNGSNSRYIFSSPITIGLTDSYTIEFWCKGILDGFRTAIGYTGDAVVNEIMFSTGRIYIESNTNGDNANPLLNSVDENWHHYIVIIDQADLSVYQDAVDLNASHTFIDSFTFDQFGRRGTTSGYFDGCISTVRFYDEVLTQSQINKLYSDFQHSFPVVETKRNFVYPKPTDLSNEDGLVGGYNMIPQNGELVDISGNGNTGAVEGLAKTVEGMASRGHNIPGKVEFSTPILNDATVWTVHTYFDGYIRDNFDFYIGGDNTKNFLLYNGTYVAFRDSASNYHPFNGSGNTVAVTGTSLQNKDVVLSWVSDGTDIGLYVDGYYKGYITPTTTQLYITQFFQGYSSNIFTPTINIKDVRIYNRALTLQEIEDYANQITGRIYLRDTFSDQGVGTTLPTGWQQGTGTYEVKELTTADPVLSDIRIGYKYLECTTAGTLVIQSEQAYGTWEFDVYKGNTSNLTYIYILADRSTNVGLNGYNFVITTTEAVWFQKRNSGSGSEIIASSAAYVLNNTWYRIKITRDSAGKFYMYIKGGAFGEIYTLVDVTGGSGTNPVTDNSYTTSKYKILDLDAGDRIGLDPSFQGVETINENMTLAGYLPLTH